MIFVLLSFGFDFVVYFCWPQSARRACESPDEGHASLLKQFVDRNHLCDLPLGGSGKSYSAAALMLFKKEQTANRKLLKGPPRTAKLLGSSNKADTIKKKPTAAVWAGVRRPR